MTVLDEPTKPIESPPLYARAILKGLGEGLEDARAGLVEPESFAVAVLGDDSRAVWVEPAFRDLMGDAQTWPECEALARQARVGGRSTGLASARGGRSVVVEARLGGQGGQWPLPAQARAALRGGAGRVLLIAFAPSRSKGLALVSARALGLAPQEAALAAALLEAPSLASAAASIGMNGETAKDTLRRACRRLAVKGAAGLVERLVDLSCAPSPMDERAMSDTLRLTPAEFRVASRAARGQSVSETAWHLGVAPATVKAHRKAIFAKTGAARDRDLRRLMAEASRVADLVKAAEVVLDDRAEGEWLRMLSGAGGRRVALIEYGPASGRPLFVMHGYNSWRRLPMSFVEVLRRDGWRPIVVQRPGYGLTDPAHGDFLSAAAADMAGALDALGGERAAVFARGPGVAGALAFAERHPGRFLKGVLVNPQPTRNRAPRGGGRLQAGMRLLLRRPALIAPIVDQAWRRTSSRNLRALIERLYGDVDDAPPSDRPDILDHLVRDAQALCARSTRGLIDELSVYAGGWGAPPDLIAGPWRVAVSAGSWSAEEAEACSRLPGYERREIEGVAVLRAYTAPEPLAALLRD